MPEYNLIFGAVLVLNAAVTFRASSYWRTFGPGSAAGLDADGDEDPTPLVGGAEGDEEAAAPSSTHSSAASDAAADIRHGQLLRKYLAVYLLAAGSDWLQGPYVYALYDAYGYSQHDIAVLFVAGFGSSMVFGSFVGGMADRGGRRKFVVLFAVIYAMSCATKHFKSFWVLMLGRLLGGIATSLLFSVFETWLIGAHASAGVMSHLGKSFSIAQYGNSIVAIVAGQVAERAANYAKFHPVSDDSGFYVGGYLGPFDISLITLIVCGVLASSLWEENYGDATTTDQGDDEEASKSDKSAAAGGLRAAFAAALRSPDIMACGVISSLFEGSMYIFVFMWTPALKALAQEELGDEFEGLPFGIIFSTFMVCCMAGSSIFSIAMETMRPERLAVFVFATAAAAFALVVRGGSATSTLLGMNLFEMCVGMYFPSMGTMKAAIVPEDKRAATYNLFRIPLNFIVLCSLLTDLTPKVSFTLCGAMLVVCTALQTKLQARRAGA